MDRNARSSGVTVLSLGGCAHNRAAEPLSKRRRRAHLKHRNTTPGDGLAQEGMSIASESHPSVRTLGSCCGVFRARV